MVYVHFCLSLNLPTAAKFEEEDPQETDIEESIAALEVRSQTKYLKLKTEAE